MIFFPGNPESLTVMFTCDSYLIEISLPHNAIIKNCSSDFCNRPPIIRSSTMDEITSTLQTTILQNTCTNVADGPI